MIITGNKDINKRCVRKIFTDTSFVLRLFLTIHHIFRIIFGEKLRQLLQPAIYLLAMIVSTSFSSGIHCLQRQHQNILYPVLDEHTRNANQVYLHRHCTYYRNKSPHLHSITCVIPSKKQGVGVPNLCLPQSFLQVLLGESFWQFLLAF